MKYLSFFLIAMIALVGTASADSSVRFASSPAGNYFADASGAVLANGSLVLVGSFDNSAAISEFTVAQITQDAGWSLFGESVIADVLGNGGKLKGSVFNDTSEADAFGGQQIFLWVFNAPTVATATEYGIFTAFGSDLEWLFATDQIVGESYIELDDLGLTAYLGTIDGNALKLAAIAVPEPSVYAFALGAAGLGFVALRRRGKQSSRHG